MCNCDSEPAKRVSQSRMPGLRLAAVPLVRDLAGVHHLLRRLRRPAARDAPRASRRLVRIALIGDPAHAQSRTSVSRPAPHRALSVHRRRLLAARRPDRRAGGHEVHLPERLLDGPGQRLARHGLPHPDRGDAHRRHGRQRRRDPGHRRRRRRLRQRAVDDPDGAGVRAQRRGRDPHRGSGLPQALRPHRGQDDHQRGSGRREIPRGRRHPRPDEPGLRHHRPHRRLRRGGRQPAGGHPPRPRLRRRRRGPGVARAVEPGPRAGRRLRQGHA